MRVLVVEDEIKLANAIKHALETQKYVVDVAGDGETGLDLAIGENYDLVILDLMLPKVEGTEICRRMRQEGIATPVLILTAKGQISDKVAGLDAGADDYMVKPFPLEELFARIRALVRRSSHTGDPSLKIADLVLDPVALRVTKNGRLIELSVKEFSILEYLIRHKNAVISRQQLLDHIWNYDSNVLSGTVEVHIKHLRDKIDTPFGSNLIRTIRGFGYEIRDDG
jgi:DNA-binding response OmpR family regulator